MKSKFKFLKKNMDVFAEAIDYKEFKKNLKKKNKLKKNLKSKNKKNANKKFDFKKLFSKDYKAEIKEGFNALNAMHVLLVVCAIIAFMVVVSLVTAHHIDKERLHVSSEKSFGKYSEKDTILKKNQNLLEDSEREHTILSSTNLNTAYLYGEVLDDDDKRFANREKDLAEPVFLNPDEENKVELIDKSVAGQVYKKLKIKHDMLINTILDYNKLKPYNFVLDSGLNMNNIIGEYNPEDSGQVRGKRYTYFMDKFSNININIVDADGNKMDDLGNLKDIMSMASVYTYYKDYKDVDTYLKYCYNLYDKSYAVTATLSEVYYCSGCMNYDSEDKVDHRVTVSRIPESLNEQKFADPQYEAKAGNLEKVDINKLKVNNIDYDLYKSFIIENGHNPLNNYCPGHVDLNVTLTYRCLNNENGLVKIDDIGNRGIYFTTSWSGWDKMMINKAKTLSDSDWYVNYGLKIDDSTYLKPLEIEQINYYLTTIMDETADRKKLIKKALESVSRIPYYYAGKPRTYGYAKNTFNERVKKDYKGRVLNGLDCSGYITWVYWSTFLKKTIKAEGTGKLAAEGTRINRNELRPGDLIVRPGYDSHVMMFLSFEPDGRVKVIHENGSENNVSIGTYEAYYPYYRRIIDD